MRKDDHDADRYLNRKRRCAGISKNSRDASVKKAGPKKTTEKGSKTNSGDKGGKMRKRMNMGMKKNKGSSRSNHEDSMAECLERFAAFPDLDNELWGDGNSRSCSILYGSCARENTEHCPHVSFKKEVDVNGKYKCYESKDTMALDLFTTEEIAFFQLTVLPYESENAHFAPYPDRSCPILN